MTELGGGGVRVVFRLDRVRGENCRPGTVELTPSAGGRLGFSVSVPGERLPRYSGEVARRSS